MPSKLENNPWKV